MRRDKQKALELRKLGKSYREIETALGIPKSTLSGWFSDIKWSQGIKKNLAKKALYIARERLQSINKTRQEKWEKWREGYRQEAKKEFKSLIKKPLFIAGINLYWGEGDSVLKNGNVRLANTDHRMIAVFCRFLRDICKVPREKIGIWILLYPDLSENDCKTFWSSVSGLNLSQFKKSQIIHGSHLTKRLINGVCNIQVCSRGLKEKIMVWIDMFSKK